MHLRVEVTFRINLTCNKEVNVFQIRMSQCISFTWCRYMLINPKRYLFHTYVVELEGWHYAQKAIDQLLRLNSWPSNICVYIFGAFSTKVFFLHIFLQNIFKKMHSETENSLDSSRLSQRFISARIQMCIDQNALICATKNNNVLWLFPTSLRTKHVAVIHCGGVDLAFANTTTVIVIKYYQCCLFL